MALLETIEADLTDAIKSGDNFGRDTLRFLKSGLKNAEIEAGTTLNDDQVVSLIQKEVKKRAEAATLYEQADKPDLAKNEIAEADVFKKYLPTQMSEEEIANTVREYLQKNPTEMSQMGVAMGELSAQMKGKADMGTVSRLLRDQIQNR